MAGPNVGPNGEIRYASDKQVRYIMYLLRQTGQIRSPFVTLGVPRPQWTSSIEQWLRTRNIAEASALITRLKVPSL